MFRDLLLDIRVGIRGLLRRPAFAAITIGVLALGVGATTSIFTLINRIFLEPPPLVEREDRLVRLFRQSSAGYGSTLAYPDYIDYRDRARSLAGLLAWSSPVNSTARIDGTVIPVAVGLVSENYFALLGIRPHAGRFFHPDENTVPEGHPVAVLSLAAAERMFGGATGAVGRSLQVNDRTVTIIGVVPRAFRGVLPAESERDVYLTLMMLPVVSPQSSDAWRVRLPDERHNWLFVVGRLADGATEAQALAELATVATSIHAGRSEETVAVTLRYRWYPATFASLARLTTLLMGAVLILLLVAAGNATVLLLARATSRARETGIRTALGAGPGRVMRQLLAESLVLGVAGGTLGLVVSVAATRTIGGLLPVTVPLALMPAPVVLGFGLLLAIGTATVVGTIPAWNATRADVTGLIQGRTRRAGNGLLRDGLVVCQVALSLMLVTGAALFGRSLVAALRVEPGFDVRNALLLTVNLDNRGYDAARGRLFHEQARSQLEGIPGVTATTLLSVVPFRGEWSGDLGLWAGHSFAGGAETVTVGRNAVGTDYFATMGIPLVEGRGFADTDGPGAPLVAVVNRTFVRKVFPTGTAVGRSVPLLGDGGPPVVIVGVVEDATYYTFGEEPQAFVYASLAQVYQGTVTLVARTSGDPLAVAQEAQRAIHTLDPSLPLTRIETMQGIYDEQLAGYRTTANVVGLAGVIALLLASAGLFGAMAYRVAQQAREIGVRMALGASRGLVARAVLKRGLGLTMLGVGLGVVGALALGRLIEGFLYGVPPRDPLALIGAPFVLLLVATAAVVIPARRAMSVDPMIAIRSE